MDLRDKAGEKNITLVGGLNGRGKTTLHDAILIALYDRQALKYIQEKARSYDRFLAEHIHKNATDNTTSIGISLTLDDGTDLCIKRSWGWNGNKLDRQLTVEKNGMPDKYLAENWNYYVEEILPFGIARFFFFNNEKITQLADDTSFEQIKSSIKSAIGVTAIEKTITHLDEIIRRKESAIHSFVNSELNQEYTEVEKRIADIDAALSDSVVQANSLQKQCETLSAKRDAKEKEFWSSGGELGRNREAIKAEMKKISDGVEAIQAEILKTASEASTPLFLCRSLVSQAYDREKNAQEEAARRRSDEIVTAVCDRIMQKIDEGHFDSHVSLAVKNIILEEIKIYTTPGTATERTDMSATSMTLFQHLFTQVFQTLEQRIGSLIAAVESQESELLNLDAHLGNTDDKTIAIQLFEALKEIEKEKALADAAYEKLREQQHALKQQRENFDAKRISLIKAIAEKENVNDDNARIIQYAAMSIEVLTEFKARLQASKLTQLSDAVTGCFKRLVEKGSLISRIAIEPRTLDITLIDSRGNELQKSQLSAGEQQMFAISIVWALALTSGYKAPVVIDTPMARLDSAHRINFITKYLPNASSQVIVLSTDEEVYGQYLDLIRDKVADYYTLLYHEDEQCTSIVPGYLQGGEADDYPAIPALSAGKR